MDANEIEILKEAYSNCGFKFPENATIQELKEDVTEVELLLADQKDSLEDCEDDIKSIQRKAEEKILKKKERISHINEIMDDNQTYLSQRKEILREFEVIEYKKLNPDLDIF